MQLTCVNALLYLLEREKITLNKQKFTRYSAHLAITFIILTTLVCSVDINMVHIYLIIMYLRLMILMQSRRESSSTLHETSTPSSYPHPDSTSLWGSHMTYCGGLGVLATSSILSTTSFVSCPLPIEHKTDIIFRICVSNIIF